MVVGLGGLEPPTSRLSGVRSNHLSYRPKLALPWQDRRRPTGGFASKSAERAGLRQAARRPVACVFVTEEI